jgi:fluoroquinolone transport system ATP-binding protein
MIEVKEMSFTYKGNSQPTLTDLDFKIEDGEIFGFLGPSGAGKSTTQKILFGLLKDYRGSAKVMGREISEWSSELYETIGVSFEMPNHYGDLTALENLEYFQTLYKESREPEEVLEWVGLVQDANKRVKDFSKGMKVRLNVARSILHKPKLLFLDEPTAGLDPMNARKIKDLIQHLRTDGATVFITTHNMTVADELCDNVAFIANGKISTINSPDALKKKYGKRLIDVEYAAGNGIERKTFDMDALHSDEDFFKLIRSGSRLESVHSQETTLENIFIELTGQELDR